MYVRIPADMHDSCRTFAVAVILGIVYLCPAVLCAPTSLSLSLFSGPDAPTCSDGTPSGVYRGPGDGSSRGLVLLFEGGGACRNQADCTEEYDEEPFKFSSSFWYGTLTCSLQQRTADGQTCCQPQSLPAKFFIRSRCHGQYIS